MQQEIVQGFRLSPQQRRVWLLQQTAQAFPYLSRCVVEITGKLDSQLFEKAIASVIEQHEILRTTFTLLPGMTIPIQTIAETGVLSLQLHDWQRLSNEHRQARIESLFAETEKRKPDFARLPLLESSLAQLSNETHLWIISAPALCLDQLSLASFVTQVSSACDALDSRKTVMVESMQYADFAEWQNELLEAEDASAGIQYWRQRDLLEANATKLPFEKQGQDEDFQPASFPVVIDRETASRIRTTAESHGVSQSSFLMGCWDSLLWRMTGSELVVGTSYDGQKYEELAGALGLFGRFVPLRNEARDELPFSRLLKQVHETTREADQWQDYFSWGHLGTVGDDSNRFFPYCFELKPAACPFSAARLTFSLLKQDSCSDRFRLKFSCQENQQSWLAELNYDTSSFSPDDIARVALSLQTLIEDASSHPDKKVGELEILSPAQRHQLVVDFNDTRRAYPTGQCVHQLFEFQAKKSPHNAAVVFERDTLTYQELNVRANQLAHYLRGIGVGPDLPVGLCLNRSVEMIVGLLGIVKAGGAYVPLDPALPKPRLLMMLQEAGARVVVTAKELEPLFCDYDVSVVGVDADLHAQESGANLESGVTAENLVYVVFTSGSTGRPKGVAVEHRQLVNYVVSVSEKLDLGQLGSFAMVSTVAADLGNTVLFPSLLRGATLHVISEERAANPTALADYFRRNPIDCLKIVPTHLGALLSGEAPAEIIPRRRLILGGEACPWKLVERIKMLSPGTMIFNHYGPTEATVGAVAGRLDESQSSQSNGAPLGTPLSNTQVYILDHHLQPVPIGVTGELYIAGDGVARCYIKHAPATAEKFVPNPLGECPGSRMYHTGDLARYTAGGRLEFIGRIDNQVKIRGYRIELGDIEASLRDLPGVRQVLVVVREDSPGDRRLVAYLESDDRERPSQTMLRDILKGRLPEYMLPSAFVFLDHLPFTANGKVDRNKLSPPEDSPAEQPFVPPRNGVEQTLSEIWTKVLGLTRVGIHHNFFELGGDSILSIQIIARANQAGLRLTPRQLFEHQTIAELAVVAGTTESPEIDQGLVSGTTQLTPVQRRFFLQELPEPYYYNQAVLLSAKQSLSPVLLEQAVTYLLVHHDALRLRFTKTATGWQQFNSLPGGNAPFMTIDLSHLTEPDAEAAIEELASQLQASLNLQDGPLLRITLFNRGDLKQSRVLIVIHHLAVDTVSWQILLEDLEAAYQQLGQGEAVSLPAKTTSFRTWAERLTAYASSAALRSELPEWQALSHVQVTPLPLDRPSGQNTADSSRSVSESLGSEETLALLQEVPAAYRTQINEVLLTALVRTFQCWTGSLTMLVELEGHGREDLLEGVDPSRTVGWFTTIFPVALDIQGAETIGEALRLVKEQLRKIPNRGIGYGLLRYSSGDESIAASLQALPQPEVRFNYLGQRGAQSESALLTISPGPTGPTQSRKGRRPYLLDIIGRVVNSELQLDWIYSENIFRRETVMRLARGYIEELRTLTGQRGSLNEVSLSPTDFPKARVSHADLNKVLARLKQK